MNKSKWIYGSALVVLILFVTVGCFKLGDIIKVPVPKTVQQANDIPPRISYNQSLKEYESWKSATQITDSQWRADIIEGGNDIAMVKSFLAEGLPLVGNIPGLGFASLGIAFLGGWLGLSKPGDKKKVTPVE